MKLAITLAWPDKRLWPNDHSHWAARAEAHRAARDEGYIAARDAMNRAPFTYRPNGQLSVMVLGYRPDRRARDLDNLLAACKHQLDGIAAALGIDDRRFRPAVDWGEDRPPRGGVTVTVEM